MAWPRRSEGGNELEVVDIRRIETAGDNMARCLETKFEIEIETSDSKSGGRRGHVFLAQGRFEPKAEDKSQGWNLTGLSWTRLK